MTANLSVAAKVAFGGRQTTEDGKPDEKAAKSQFESYEGLDGPFEIAVPPEYNAGAKPQTVVRIRREQEVNIVAMANASGATDITPAPGSIISGALSLLAYGSEEVIDAFVRDYGLVLEPGPRVFRKAVEEPAVAGVVEIVISPRSSFVGRTIGDVGFRSSFGVSPLALHQGERATIESWPIGRSTSGTRFSSTGRGSRFTRCRSSTRASSSSPASRPTSRGPKRRSRPSSASPLPWS